MQHVELGHYLQGFTDFHRRFDAVRQDYPDLKTCQRYYQSYRLLKTYACGFATNCRQELFFRSTSHSFYSCCTCSCLSKECRIKNTHSTSSDTRTFCKHILLYAIYLLYHLGLGVQPSLDHPVYSPVSMNFHPSKQHLLSC